MNYNDALKVISQKQSLGIKPGLDRILKLLDFMGNPQDNLKIIHIAGTNGKGTVSATIADCLCKAGYKTGLFTSPWVIDYTEQIQINGSFIPGDILASYVEQYKDFDVTEFELLTSIMYKYFSDEKVDYAVIECGMGGKGDATNVEKNNVSLITSVSLDHTKFLGNTVEEIAAEKSGIIRPNSKCVLYPNKACEKVFETACKKQNTLLIKVEECDDYRLNNLATVNHLLSVLDTPEKLISKALVRLPARKEKLGNVLLDGGHNMNSALTLSPLLGDSEVAVMGMMADKDVEGYMSLIAPHCKTIITTTPDNPRSMQSDKLAEIAKKYCNDVLPVSEPEKAVKFAKEQGLTLVCGSFFLARQVRKDLI